MNKKELAQNLEEYRATGGSRAQLDTLHDIVAETGLIDQERRYFQAELLPTLISSFNSAIFMRREVNRNKDQEWAIEIWLAILTAVSSTTIIPDDKKYVPLIVTTIALAIKAYIEKKAKYHQPELNFLINRKILDGLLGESIDRLTGTGEYAGLPDQEAFVLMARNCKNLLNANEAQLQEIIKSTLSNPYQDEARKER